MHTRCSGIGKKHCNIRESERKREIEIKKRGVGRRWGWWSHLHSRARKEGIREREEREEFSHRFLLLDASPFLALPVPKTTSYFLQQARRERKKVLYRSERKCGGAEIPPSWYTICRSELTARGRGGFANVIKPTLANLADGMKRDLYFFAMVHNELFFLQR